MSAASLVQQVGQVPKISTVCDRSVKPSSAPTRADHYSKDAGTEISTVRPQSRQTR